VAYTTREGCTRRQALCPVRLVVYMSLPCRNTALHLASENGHTESVKALLEKGAVNAANIKECAFPCGLYWMGDVCTRRARLCAFRVVLERVCTMQEHGTASRIFQRPHGECEGAAREGRGRERREHQQVRVSLWPVKDAKREKTARPARLCSFWLEVDVSAPCRSTALHRASSNGHTESVKALLEKGADVNAENIKECAFSCGLVLDGRRLHAPGKRCARFGSRWSVSAPCRWTALHYSSKNGHTESVRALLEKGADVHAANINKCAFPHGLYCTRRLHAPAIECSVRLVVERVCAMQEHSTAPRI
jgi:hypothetical protein